MMAQPKAWSRRAIVGTALCGGGLALPVADAMARQTPLATPARAGDRSTRLIRSEELNALRDEAGLRIVALTPEEAFAKGHIPGATAVDWPAMELGTTTDAAISDWAASMRELVATLGIDPASDVVIYDDGTLFAARLWWLLAFLGHETKRVLDGGYPAWQRLGLPVTDDAGKTRAPAGGAVTDAPVRADVLAPLAEVEAALGADDVVFVDARTPEEYMAGHIPGAVNVNYPLNAEPDAPRFWKPDKALIALYADVGVTPDKRIIPYCSTGVRSAVTWFTLGMIGFLDVSLFTGSWAEWSAHPELPVVTGSQP
ncbi:MAG TPA: rhodanese-like domain-containing protein [Thermomicrobiales bacterium]|nr:rhodanese-like domain-containing protein [Thermomicrobiales bacterium]